MKVELRGITKRFPGVVACNDVDLSVEDGEVHALLGENGAGKSTLMNILFGLYRADEGEILLDGKPLQASSPADAIAAGVGMVHQHFMLVPVFTVAENVVLGVEPTGATAWRSTRTPPSRTCRSASSSGSRSSRRSIATPASSSSTSPPRCSRRPRSTS